MSKKLKVFKLPVLIVDGTPDAQGDTFGPDCEISFATSVPVVRNYKVEGPQDVLGQCELTLEDKTVYATIELDLERLSEDLAKLSYPAVGGHILERIDGKIRKCSIDKLALTGAPNVDPRIKRLGEYE